MTNPSTERGGAWRQLAKNVLTNYLSLLLSGLSLLVLTPYVVARLGSALFGVWMLMTSVVGYLGLLDLGLQTTVVRHVSSYRARNELEKLEVHVGTLLVAYGAIGVLALIGAVIVGSNASRLFRLPQEVSGQVLTIFLLGGLGLAVRLPSSLLGGVLQGFQRYDINNWVGAASVGATFLLTIALLEFGYGLTGLLWLNFIMTLFTGIVRGAIIVRKLGVRIAPTLADWHELKQAAGYSVWVFLLTIAARLTFETDTITISVFLPVVAVTTYTVAYRMVDAVARLVFGTVDVLFPVFTQIEASRGIQETSRLYLQAVKLALVIALPFFIVFVVFGKELIQAWMGGGFEGSYPVLVLLTLAMLFHLPGHVSAILLLSTARHRMLAVLGLADALLNVILSVVLVQRIGLPGVALGTLIALSVSNGVIIPAYTCRLVGTRFTSYLGVLSRCVGPALAITVVGVAVSAGEWVKGRPSLLILAGVSTLVVFLTMYVTFVLTAEERNLYQAQLRRVLAR